jgi:hypothetical protein
MFIFLLWRPAVRVAPRSLVIKLASALPRGDMCDAGQRVADLVCYEFVKPLIALCLAGSSRSFTQPLVHRSIQTNLIDAIGGELTVFAAIKAGDGRGDRRPDFGALLNGSVDKWRATLDGMRVPRENTLLADGALQPGQMEVPP